MSQRFGKITIKNGVPATQSGLPNSGYQGFLIGNESGLTCDIFLEGTTTHKTLYPGTVDFFPSGRLFSGTVFIVPTLNIVTAILYPSSDLWFDGVSISEDVDPSAYPMALPRPMTAGTSSPQSGFSAFVVFSTSAAPTNRQMLNIFNPANSGVVGRIFSIQIKQVGAGYCVANLSQRTDGTDNNFAGAATAITHNIGGAGSKMNVTFANNTAIPAQNVFVGTTALDNDLYDFAATRGAYYLNPGQNLTMDVQDAIALSLIFMAYDWTEA